MDGNAKTTESDQSPAEFHQPPESFEQQPIGESPEEPAPFQDQWMQEQEVQPQEIHDVVYEDIIPEPAIEPEDPGDLSDVSEYANSDQAFGPLSYSVTIENIDTKETRQLLLEALTDPKFGWDPKELLKQVKLGQLKFENLNPVKASVLVQKLQDVPVKVSWIQNVFS